MLRLRGKRHAQGQNCAVRCLRNGRFRRKVLIIPRRKIQKIAQRKQAQLAERFRPARAYSLYAYNGGFELHYSTEK